MKAGGRDTKTKSRYPWNSASTGILHSLDTENEVIVN